MRVLLAVLLVVVIVGCTDDSPEPDDVTATPLLELGDHSADTLEPTRNARPVSNPPRDNQFKTDKSHATITNSIGMKLRLIPAGEFLMGSPVTEKDRDDNETQHRVKITSPFYLGVYEVTQRQWQSVMGTMPWKGQDFTRAVDEHPSSSVSWEDARSFCRKLSSMPKEKATGHVHRLPTEAEWEYACRAGTTTAYSFGNDATELDRYGWWGGLFGEGNAKDEQYAHGVGLKRPNAWGLYDMHGNVFEWCSDWYGDYPSGAVTNPTGPPTGSARVLRGGSWDFESDSSRSASRFRYPPGGRNISLGFRVLRSSIK